MKARNFLLKNSFVLIITLIIGTASSVAAGGFDFDVDKDGQSKPLTDGLLIIRHLFGFTGSSLTSNAIADDAQVRAASEITAYLKANSASLDIDDDGQVLPLTDGLLIIRFLFGFTGEALVNGAVASNAKSTSPDDIKGRLIAVDSGSNLAASGSDTTAPVINLVGDATVTLPLGTNYTDAGATATDNTEGDLTSSIIASGTVTTGTAGTYTITYSVSDAAGNDAATVTRAVTVTGSATVANRAPVIATVPGQTIQEGLFKVVAIEATDPDGDTLTFAVSGTDGASFSITSTGVLIFNNAPDFETRSSYEVTVTVSDGTTASTLPMTISIIDEVSEMSIFSTAFKNTGSANVNLPLSHTCYGANGGISPALSWSGASAATKHFAVLMYRIDTDGNEIPNFSVFNIPANKTSLPAGDFSLGTAATGNIKGATSDTGYSAPCMTGAGTETFYYFTVYALSSELSLSSTATQADVKMAAIDSTVGSTTLKTRSISYDAAAIASNAHVPKSVASTCEAKTAHFNEYSNIHTSITCDEAKNEIIVASKLDSGLKTAQADQQIGTGTTSWIGRLALPSASGASLRIAPDYLNGVNNNFECSGAGGIGISIDGQPMFPYYKQGSTTGNNCGPTDGDSYHSRDTVLIGEVDQCYGHSPNGEGYHLHGAPICLMDVHDPSKPVAYMTDGIPLYFGQAGGSLDQTDAATSVAYSTPTNYGAGLYDHLDYRPSDVKDGTNPLNACNAYDINSDGPVSGYAYYTTKEAPYSIGCYQGNVLSTQTRVGGGTKLTTARQGWNGQTLGEAMDVSISSNTYGQFNADTYNITEFSVRENGKTPSFLTEGKTAQVMWRILNDTDTNYDPSTTCFEFRYRKDKEDTTSDETEIHCSERPIDPETLSFTPYGN